MIFYVLLDAGQRPVLARPAAPLTTGMIVLYKSVPLINEQKLVTMATSVEGHKTNRIDHSQP